MGCLPRAWDVRNTISARTARPSAISTLGAPKPSAPASITPYVSPLMATTAAICPVPSSGASRRGERAILVNSSSATRPTGRLTKKIARQLSRVRKPPSTGPAAEATAPPIAQTAMAQARSTRSG